MTPLDEIRDAISMEARENAAPIDCQVQAVERMGAVWKVWLEPFQIRQHLDESLEGSAVWWPGPPKGAADILSVVPDEWQINLRFASTRPPAPGGRIKIYRPQFLEKLEDIWRDERWSQRCLRSLDSLRGISRKTVGSTVLPDAFSGLRPAQRQAFDLPQYDFSFLWGPPGTGKTTTIGMLAGSYLAQFPKARILLLSTTNVAVDEALLSADDALTKLPGGKELRDVCRRVGNHFLASHYRDRRHLLPVVDDAALQRLVQLEASRPDAVNVAAYAEWKRAVEEQRRLLRANAKEVLCQCRLAAMTTTRAVFDSEMLREFAPYELMVFDESSQISVPHALALSTLGRSVIFAGDPKQLAPIVQSNAGTARKWMGESPFRFMNRGPASCFLNEQSRMAEPICRAVSHTFYEGQLIVAEKERTDPGWQAQRQLHDVPGIGNQAVSIIDVPEDGFWSPSYGGAVRKWSADRIVQIVAAMVRDRTEDIVVLVPFRAQRSMVKKGLRNAGLSRIKVTTVHRAQGSQKHTVIFDPVDGACKFITDESIGPRLINVAVSRAQARVVLLLSAGDRSNPILDQIAKLAAPLRTVPHAFPLEEVVSRPGFPGAFIGKDVVFRAFVGTFKGYSADQQKLIITEASTQRDRMISIKMFAPGKKAGESLEPMISSISEHHENGNLIRMQAEVHRLRAENERLKQASAPCKVSEKGALSVYGLGRFPITLYREQWLKLLDNANVIRAFIAKHPELRMRGRE